MLVKHLVHCLNDVVIHIVHPFFSNCNSYLIDSFLQHTFDKKILPFPVLHRMIEGCRGLDKMFSFSLQVQN